MNKTRWNYKPFHVMLSLTLALSVLLSASVLTVAAPSPELNLLNNPGAETGDLSGWTILESGGNGWSVINGGYEGDNCFITSWKWCKRYQEIDLLAEGYTEAELDAAPNIAVGEWFAGYGDLSMYDYAQDDYAYLKVELRDASHAVIDSYDTGVFQLTSSASGWFGPWTEKSHLFSGYGPGLRYIYFEDGGDDREHWAGFYGAALDSAYINFQKIIIESEFSATPTIGATPMEVQFTDETPGDFLDWNWDFGDGGTSNEQNPSHIYNYPGPFTVSLAISNASEWGTATKVDYIHPYTIGVGGEAYPVNKSGIVLPWVVLGLAIVAGSTVVLRRRRSGI